MNLDDMTEDELDNLAKDGNGKEKRAVAIHPNTSIKTLRYLARIGFAEEVDRNPLMPLYIEVGSEDAVFILEMIARRTKR